MHQLYGVFVAAYSSTLHGQHLDTDDWGRDDVEGFAAVMLGITSARNDMASNNYSMVTPKSFESIFENLTGHKPRLPRSGEA